MASSLNLLRLILRLCAASGAVIGGLSLAALLLGDVFSGPQIAYSSARLDDRSGIYLLDAERGFTRRLVNGFEAVWSPDGERFVYLGSANDFDLFIYDLGVGTSQPLTRDAAFEVGASWSPDGEHLTFASVRQLNYEIYSINADGSDLRRLTENPNSDVRPVWSPDGEHIAFISNRDGIAGDAYVMDSDGENVRRLTYRVGVVDLDWSPDGERIALIASLHGLFELFMMSADGGTETMPPDEYLQRLTYNIMTETRLDWSPDGEYIVFSSPRMDGRVQVYALDVEAALAGGSQYAPRTLIDNERDNSAPAWRPR